MSQSIQNFASAGLISTPLGSGGDNPSPAEFSAAVGGSKLAVDGNAVDTGRYLIIGSNASTHGSSSNANDGQVTIFDKLTNTYLNAWGDPHLTASDGNVAEFQQDGLAIDLADGTTVEIQPTALSNGVAHISEVAVTNSSGTVLMSNFEGQAGSQVDVSAVQSGNAHAADPSMGNISDTVLVAGKQDIGALTTLGGGRIASTDPTFNLDGIGGGVAQYFTNYLTSSMIAVGGQSMGSVASNSEQPAQPVATSANPVSAPDLGLLMQSLAAQIASSPTLNSDQKLQAMTSLEMTQAQLSDAPAPGTAAAVPSAAAGASDNPDAGISRFTIDNILRVSNGLAPIAAPDATAAAPAGPAAVSTTVPGMVDQLAAMIGNSSLNSAVKTALTDSAQNLGALLTAPSASGTAGAGGQASAGSAAPAPAATPSENTPAPAAQATVAKATGVSA